MGRGDGRGARRGLPSPVAEEAVTCSCIMKTPWRPASEGLQRASKLGSKWRTRGRCPHVALRLSRGCP